KIYTTNIDDLIEKIYEETTIKITVQNSKNENLSGKNNLQYYKLHGCVRNKKDGFIFTNQDYINKISGNMDFKLSEFTHDSQKQDIIFLGTSFDEIDIEYYLNLYKNSGYQSGKGTLVFINPYVPLKLKTLVKSVDGIIINWTTEEFLNYVDELKYNPDKIKSLEKRLSYHGFNKMSDIRMAFDVNEKYTSRLYEGFEAKWEDIFQEWDFINPLSKKIVEDIKSKNGFLNEKNIHCVAIAGDSYLGKTTMLKRIASDLSKDGFNIIEFNGKEFQIDILKQYIIEVNSDKFALIFDNASPNYPIIERLLKSTIPNKELFIIVASRRYYHNKKKYYLEDNSYNEYILRDKISHNFAKNILERLSDKGYMGYLRKQSKDLDRIRLIRKEPELMTLMIKLSGEGSGFKRIIEQDVKTNLKTSKLNKDLLVLLAILDRLDVEYLPSELITIMYNTNYNKIIGTSELFANAVKASDRGISIRNEFYSKNILREVHQKEKLESIYNILINISSLVSENKLNYYKIIFEHLTKEEKLRIDLGISAEQIKEFYYRIKEYYEDISYYWLQLGLIEQHLGDFTRALNHLEQAEGIKPNTYQIEHAIARNYLRHANSLENLSVALELFEIGEKKLIKLIENQEILQPLAYSINCYLNEKIKFINKFNLVLEESEYKRMFRYVKIMISKNGIRTERDIFIIKKFTDLLNEKKMYGVMKFSNNDREIYNILKEKNLLIS
uniref:SIR2 family protein n=1 Tax=Clostridium cuniculi TaxID=2548455 RepID=UPI0018AC1BE0